MYRTRYATKQNKNMTNKSLDYRYWNNDAGFNADEMQTYWHMSDSQVNSISSWDGLVVMIYSRERSMDGDNKTHTIG